MDTQPNSKPDLPVWTCNAPCEWFTKLNVVREHLSEFTSGLAVPAELRNPHCLFLFITKGICPTTNHEFFRVMYCHKELATRIIQQMECCHKHDDDFTKTTQDRLDVMNDLMKGLGLNWEHRGKRLPLLIIAETATSGVFSPIPYTINK